MCNLYITMSPGQQQCQHSATKKIRQRAGGKSGKEETSKKSTILEAAKECIQRARKPEFIRNINPFLLSYTYIYMNLCKFFLSLLRSRHLHVSFTFAFAFPLAPLTSRRRWRWRAIALFVVHVNRNEHVPDELCVLAPLFLGDRDCTAR